MTERFDAYGELLHLESKGQLTQKEKKVLDRCRAESLTKTALPGAGAGALIFYFLSKSVKKLRFHVSAVGLVFGFLLGKAAYNPICVDRLMVIGDGNLRKSYEKFSERNKRIPFASGRVPDATGDFTRLDTLPVISEEFSDSYD